MFVIADRERLLMRDAIMKDLKKQLKAKNNKERYFIDLINDYLSLWDTKEELIADIKKRGVSIYWENGGGQNGYKKNDSVSDFTKVNAQMLKILNELGLKVNVKKDDSGGDDLGI